MRPSQSFEGLSRRACAGRVQSAPIARVLSESNRIELKLNARVAAIDTAKRRGHLTDGTRHAYDALLLATGAEPVRLDVPGSDLPHVHYLRTLADGDALVAKAMISQRAVVIGASFIGLEVTASLRARNIAVHVVAPDAVPMERILGTEVGDVHPRASRAAWRDIPSRHHRCLDRRARRHLEDGRTSRTPIWSSSASASGRRFRWRNRQDSRSIAASPSNEYLETSVPGIFAAGDIARWPDRLTGERIRVEHWVVAERQGQTAARNILGRRERFDAVPFFWTEQYDFSLAYVGHAERLDKAEIDGQLDAEKHDCTITYSSRWQEAGGGARSPGSGRSARGSRVRESDSGRKAEDLNAIMTLLADDGMAAPGGTFEASNRRRRWLERFRVRC